MIYSEITFQGPKGYPVKSNLKFSAIIVDHSLYDLLIGMPIIQAHDLLPLLEAHLATLPPLCTLCSHIPQHTTVNAYASSQANDNKHITEIFDDEEDYELESVPDISDMVQNQWTAIPSHIEGPPELRKDITDLCREYQQIFSTSLRTEPAKVPPLHFDYDAAAWQKPPNKLPARGLSVDKQLALSDLINKLLNEGIIRPSKATTWSQVVLVAKPNKGWRLTIDSRNLNKLIVNQGWQIPNIQHIINRIG